MLLGVFIPLFNFLTVVCFSRVLGKMGVIYLTFLSLTSMVIINAYNFYLVVFENNVYFFNFGAWIHAGLLQIDWEFMLDFLAVSMLAMVSLISWLVHLYSFSYMKFDPHFTRFISYLSLFTFFMFVLVSAANLVVLFVGWEGVGICSYLIINFWYTRGQANKAALKALFMNRVGDLGFLLGVVLLINQCGTVDFSMLTVVVPVLFEHFNFVFWQNGIYCFTYLDVICFSFFIGVVGKSAQVGLHTWLPAAMEGPTPVSALIHAATMVTAGIFLLIRCAFLFECSAGVQTLIIIFGAVTALLSAWTAIFLYDIKKIIAYSTCSQLGYMAVACGLSHYTLGLFHLINHAFFKALLFLTAGAIIHSFQNEQDIRKLSYLATRMPLIHSCMLAGSIAIMGLPFLSGFYSKDLIIEVVFLNSSYILGGSNFIYYCIMGATVGTGIYSLRLYYFLFLRQGTLHLSKIHRQMDISQPFFIQFAISCLLVGSLFSGYFISDLFNSLNIWGVSLNFIFSHIPNAVQSIAGYSLEARFSYFENEFLPWYIKIMPFFCNMFVLIVGLVFIYFYQKGSFMTPVEFLYFDLYRYSYEVFYELQDTYEFSYFILSYRRYILTTAKCVQFNFYFNEVYNFFAGTQLIYYFTFVFFNLDKGGLELFGPTGLSRWYKYTTKWFKRYYKQGLSSHITVMYFTVITCLYIAMFWF
jgi:proton-translocating NADH-quinone oxidoreductase chain L